MQYSILCHVYNFCMLSTTDFPAGNVRVVVYSGGVPVNDAQLQYYSSMEEIACLLSRVADPVDFMCQVKKCLPDLTGKSTVFH